MNSLKTMDRVEKAQCDAVEGEQMQSVNVLGVDIHCVDMRGVLDTVRGYIATGQPHMIVTADSYSVVLAHSAPEFREIVNGADLVTPDGSGILLGARLLGTPLSERVSGCDIAQELCRTAGEESFSVFFLGAKPGIAQAAAENMQKKCPGLAVAGVHDGYFGPEKDSEIAALVRESGASVLLVAMGIPRQEKFIRDHLHKFGVSVAMGVGGSFDVFSGKVKRAPMWMRRRGLEWAYRLAKDPSKISKVAVLPKFLWLVLKDKWFGKDRSGEKKGCSK